MSEVRKYFLPRQLEGKSPIQFLNDTELLSIINSSDYKNYINKLFISWQKQIIEFRIGSEIFSESCFSIWMKITSEGINTELRYKNKQVFEEIYTLIKDYRNDLDIVDWIACYTILGSIRDNILSLSENISLKCDVGDT